MLFNAEPLFDMTMPDNDFDNPFVDGHGQTAEAPDGVQIKVEPAGHGDQSMPTLVDEI